MERNIQKNGAVNLVVLLVVGLATFAAARYSQSLAGQVATAFFGLAVLVAVVSWFQMRLEDRERLEQMEFDEATRGGSSAALFNTQESETFPARRSREQFERYFIPGFSVLLLLLQGAAAYTGWRWLGAQTVLPLHQPLVGMAILALLALIQFILGKYSSNLVRLEQQRLLGPGASYLLLGAYLSALVVAGIVAFEAGFPKVDVILARVFCVLLALLAVENAVTLLLEIYRPRVKGKVEHLLYESRLVGLLSRPEGLFTTAAHALDYQFGFKVSDTWAYRALQEKLPLMILGLAGLLVLSSCFVFIEVGEQALRERFGRPVGDGVINPGLHVKLPWPIDQVRRFRTDEIHTFYVGHGHGPEPDEDGHGHEEADVERLTLWTVSHTKEEFRLLVASRESVTADGTNTDAARKESPPVQLLAASIPVQYQISNLVAWAYQFQNASELLENLGTREVVRYLVNADFDEITSRGRYGASEEVRRRIQAATDRLGLGVRIIFVGLQDLHPPVKVAESFEEVVAAQHKRQANLLAAATHRTQTNALATAEATNRLRRAESDRQTAEAVARARVAAYTNQIAAFRAAPQVYAERRYLETLRQAGGGARKYILATTNTHDVIQYNLEDKLREDLMNIGIPTTPTK